MKFIYVASIDNASASQHEYSVYIMFNKLILSINILPSRSFIIPKFVMGFHVHVAKLDHMFVSICTKNQCCQHATHLMFLVGERAGMGGCRVRGAEILPILKTYINFKSSGAKLLSVEH